MYRGGVGPLSTCSQSARDGLLEALDEAWNRVNRQRAAALREQRVPLRAGEALEPAEIASCENGP